MSAADKMKEALRTMEERGKIYGPAHDGFKINGKILEFMFSGKLELRSAEEFSRFLLFNMIQLKLCRYAVNLSKGGHKDSLHDAGVYCFLLEDFDDNCNRK